ncbi:MAG TPA: NAD(P)-binding protein [Herpetosiphonaceae bacterium]
MSDDAAPGRTKIAILGGGIGALTAAYELTEAPGDYEITVYQMGWRVGGKGASGRNLDPNLHHRIEEHGLHVWSGLYDNAFRVMRACYAELGRDPGQPLATWREAFKPADLFVLEEHYKGRWVDWSFTPPTNTELPGEPEAALFLPLWEYVYEGLQLMHGFLAKLRGAAPAAGESAPDRLPTLLGRIDRLLNLKGRLLGLARLLSKLTDSGRPHPIIKKLVLAALRLFMGWLWRELQPRMDHDETRKLWICLNFAYGNVRGVIEADVFANGFDILDGQDYRAWLGGQIIDDGGLTIDSPLAIFLYDADFAYRDGDLGQPDLAAGVALRTIVRMAFTWKGALIWKMQAGMGDTVFTPLYQVLRRRGVKFEFFHLVKGLHLSADRRRIERVSIGRQARLKDPTRPYEPLLNVKGLDCWPSAPLVDQLAGGDGLRGVNFESICSPVVEELELQAGADFDKVVLGIPLAVLPHICCELISASPRWKTMVDAIGTVRTQALQLWLNEPETALGAIAGAPLLTTYRATPLDTWADMAHLLPRETWPAVAGAPQTIAYFCGPQRDDPPPPLTPCGPKTDCAGLDPAPALAATRRTSLELLTSHIGHLWPEATERPGDPAAPLRWELLADLRPDAPAGPARLDSQYLRANIEPSERYVLSLSGSMGARLQPGASGFANLVLAGDWTDNSMNQGNIEATVMSGMLASNAIAGFPRREDITGVDFGRSPGRGGTPR